MNQDQTHLGSISPKLRYLLIRSLAAALTTLLLTTPPFYSTLEDTFVPFDQVALRGRACQLIETTWIYFEMIQVFPWYCTSTIHNTFS